MYPSLSFHCYFSLYTFGDNRTRIAASRGPTHTCILLRFSPSSVQWVTRVALCLGGTPTVEIGRRPTSALRLSFSHTHRPPHCISSLPSTSTRASREGDCVLKVYIVFLVFLTLLYIHILQHSETTPQLSPLFSSPLHCTCTGCTPCTDGFTLTPTPLLRGGVKRSLFGVVSIPHSPLHPCASVEGDSLRISLSTVSLLPFLTYDVRVRPSQSSESSHRVTPRLLGTLCLILFPTHRGVPHSLTRLPDRSTLLSTPVDSGQQRDCQQTTTALCVPPSEHLVGALNLQDKE